MLMILTLALCNKPNKATVASVAAMLAIVPTDATCYKIEGD